MMLETEECLFLLKLLGWVIVLISAFLWLTKSDPYDEVERSLDELEKEGTCQGSCDYAKDLGMEQYRCKPGTCVYRDR